VEVVRRDRVRRSAPHGVGVDERDHEGHEDDPPQLLEEREERPARADGGEELREVRRQPPARLGEAEGGERDAVLLVERGRVEQC
jgi:hypothetical protein